MRQFFLFMLLLTQTGISAQYINGFIGTDSTLRDYAYVINVNEPGSLSTGSEFNLIDSVPIVDGRIELRNRPWMKDYNGLIRLQVVPKSKAPYGYSIKTDNLNYFFVNNRTAVEFRLPHPLRFSEITFARIDPDNEAVQAYVREKTAFLVTSRNLRVSGTAAKSRYDSLYNTTFNRLTRLFKQDQRDITRYLVAQELIAFKMIITPDAYASALPPDMTERFSPAFRKSRQYRGLVAYYESEMK